MSESEGQRAEEPEAVRAAYDRLHDVLLELDRLALFQAGAYVAMAIDCLERKLNSAPSNGED
jgi:hypothetical protein